MARVETRHADLLSAKKQCRWYRQPPHQGSPTTLPHQARHGLGTAQHDCGCWRTSSTHACTGRQHVRPCWPTLPPTPQWLSGRCAALPVHTPQQPPSPSVSFPYPPSLFILTPKNLGPQPLEQTATIIQPISKQTYTLASLGDMASLPSSVAVDRPLKLGSTFLGEGAEDEGYYTLTLDFQPDSLQQAEHADLLLLGADQLKLVPLLPDGDGFHFEGSLEQLQQRPGSDLQCVAYFDGNEWTLQVVHAKLHTKHRPGVPLIPGYNIDAPGDEADPAAASNVAAVQQQLQSSSLQQNSAEHEIDPDLDDALEEALFAADRSSSQPPQQQQQQHSPEQPAPHPAGPGAHPADQRGPQQQMQQQQQPAQQQHRGAQPQQQQQSQPQPQHQPPAPVAPPPVTAVAAAAHADDEEESADDDSDDPWNQFDAGAAPAPAPVPAAPKPAVQPLPVPTAQPHMLTVSGAEQRSAPLHPAVPAPRQQQQQQAAVAAPVHPAAAAPPAAAAAAGASGVLRGAVSVLGGDEEEEEDAGQDAQECSEDESDGVGVEYL